MRCLASLLLFLMFTPAARGASIYCELASLPVLPLASDSSERLPPEELLSRVAESYHGLLEFGGEGISETRLSVLVGATLLDKFFEPVPGRDQRSVALNESLAKIGDWVMLEAEEHGLTQEQIATLLREVVRAHLEQAQQEQERVEETREERSDPGRETTTGHLFVRDYRFPELGEAWRDESGMVWGDVVRNPRGFNHEMKEPQALAYCKSIGAELPSSDDFIRLRLYMGAQEGTREGYSAQILPGLGDRRYGSFWTSSIVPGRPEQAYFFDGRAGHLSNHLLNEVVASVRCVRR